MEIRKLSRGEKKETRELYEEIFSEDSREFVDYYYTWKIADNDIYGVWEDGALQAMLHMNPYPMVIRGKVAKTHYIVAVATRAKYRSRGYMAALLRRTLNIMSQNEEPFTFLMPAAEAIYSRHGFRTVHRQEKPFLDENILHEEGEVWEKARGEEAEEMARYASRRLEERYELYTFRDEAYYQRLIREYESDRGCLMILRDHGDIADIRIRGDKPHETPLIMVRITHVRNLLSCLAVKETTDVSFFVRDSIVEGNHRCFRLRGVRGQEMTVTEEKRNAETGEVSVEDLTGVVFGKISPEVLAEKTEREEDKRVWEGLRHIIPIQNIYISETV